MKHTFPLRPGAGFVCPACGEQSAVKAVTRLEGWRVTGEALVCALCGAPVVVEAPCREGGTSAASEAVPGDLPVERLASFLGTQAPPVRPAGLADDGERRFCRDCREFLRHPFRSRCLLRDCDVDPMGDCPQFVRASRDENEENEE